MQVELQEVEKALENTPHSVQLGLHKDLLIADIQKVLEQKARGGLV